MYTLMCNFFSVTLQDTKGMCTLMGLCNNDVKCSEMPLVKLIPATEATKRISMIKLQPATRVSADVNSIPLVKLVPAEEASKSKWIESNDIFRKILIR